MFPDTILEDGHRISIWTYPDKLTRWAKTADEAAIIAASSPHGQNVYFGVGLTNSPPTHGRGAEDKITAITSLWLDVDVDDGSVQRGKSGRLPTTKTEAMKIVEEMRIKPSVLVFSGHGFQAYWLLRHPLIIETDEERDRVKRLSRGWNDTARIVAQSIGYTVDATHDLSRVFRVPETMNLKAKPPVRCEVVWPEGDVAPQRYDEDEIDRYVIPEMLMPDAVRMSKKIVQIAPVMPQSNSGVPAIVLAACENDSLFRRTWEGTRRDLGDGSPSSYDMSLAIQLVRFGADDQTIADAIYQRRVKQRQDPDKARRRSYVMLTISKARSEHEAESAVSEIMAMASEGTGARPPVTITNTTPSDKRRSEEVLEKISKALSTPITGITKHGRENSIYSIIVAGEFDVTIGNIDAILSQDRVRARIAETTSAVIPVFKRPVWGKIAEMMLRAATLIENEDSSRVGSIKGHLQRYLMFSDLFVHREDQWTAALRENEPFVRDDRLHVHCGSLTRHIRIETSAPVDKSCVFDALRLMGFRSVVVSGYWKEKVVCRSYWSIRIMDAEALGIDLSPRPRDPEIVSIDPEPSQKRRKKA
jgi:hypothetical protein